MTDRPKPQEIYRHFKGNSYEVLAVAKHSDTGEELVIYKALYGDGQVYARPIEDFMGKTDRNKYPDASQEYRFEKAVEKKAAEQTGEQTEEIQIDPMVMEFLEADTYEERLNILAGLKHRVTDDMITTMAIACDVEIGEGETEKRFDELKSCLVTLERYECNRLR